MIMVRSPRSLLRSISSSGQIVLTQLRKVVPGTSKSAATEQKTPVEDEFEHLNVRDFKRFLIGCAYGLFVALTNSLLYNIIKQTARPNFDAPSFVIWFRSLFRIFAFPFYVGIRWGFAKVRRTQRPEDKFFAIIWDGGKIYGERRVTLTKFVTDLFILTILSIASQWLNYAPLFAVRGPGNMASMATINLSVVFLLCIVFLKIDVMSAKLFGVALNLSGVIVLTLVEIVSNPRWQESILILPGAFFTAAYQVAFKVRIGGTTNLARINYFASFLALLMAVLMWPLVMYLRFSGIEHWEVVDIPWVVLSTSSGAVLALVLVVNAGISYVHPFFLATGFLLITPLTYGIDQILSSRQEYVVEIAGATVAFAGALILVLADVNTQSLIKTEWSHTIKTARFLKKATARYLEAKLETKTAPISAADSVLQIRNPHFNRLQSIDPSITVSDLSKSGVYRRMDSNLQNNSSTSLIANSAAIAEFLERRG